MTDLDLASIKARHAADRVAASERGFNTDVEVAQMGQDRAALLAEVERLRGLPSPTPMKWPA